ncbi:MAG: cupin domain-containing protein [Spirochaetaceae bacterium]|nr:MAG: cupin domain-containing protein [Spirochaetaceae bacterium]
MNQCCIDVSAIPSTEKDWGSLKSVFDGAGINATGGFTLGYIVYSKPHYSGVHDDHEVIYILEGRGIAMIGGQEIGFRGDFLLVVPAGTEHSITQVTEGPVRAILAHFT